MSVLLLNVSTTQNVQHIEAGMLIQMTSLEASINTVGNSLQFSATHCLTLKPLKAAKYGHNGP